MNSKKKWSKESDRLKRAYNNVLKQLRDLRNEVIDSKKEILKDKKGPSRLANALHGLTHQIDKWLGDNPNYMFKNELLEEYFSYKDFLRIWDFYDDHFTSIYSVENKRVAGKAFMFGCFSLFDEFIIKTWWNYLFLCYHDSNSILSNGISRKR